MMYSCRELNSVHGSSILDDMNKESRTESLASFAIEQNRVGEAASSYNHGEEVLKRSNYSLCKN